MRQVWLKKWLKEKNLPHFDEHFVSTHVRATETAGLLDLPDANWKLDFELRERSNGIWGVVPDEGWKEPEKNHRFYTSMPGGESIADVCGRLLRRFIPVLDRKILNNEQRAVIVAHGDLMQALRVVFEGISPDEYDRRSKESACDFRIGNGQIFHYTRIPPGKEFGFGNAFKGFGWVRSINPWDEKYAGHDWRPIPRNSKSNSDLLEMADLFPRLVDGEE